MANSNQIRRVDPLLIPEQQRVRFQELGAILYQGNPEDEDICEGVENYFSDTDSDSVFENPEETTIEHADSSLNNDRGGSPEVDAAVPTDENEGLVSSQKDDSASTGNDDSWGSSQVGDVSHTTDDDIWGPSNVQSDLPINELQPWNPTIQQDIANAPVVYASGRVPDRTYHETPIKYTWGAEWFHEVRQDTYIIRVSTVAKDFCDYDWTPEMERDYAGYKQQGRLASKYERKFESKKEEFDAKVLAAKMRADFMNKYPRAFKTGSDDNVANHRQAVYVAIKEAENTRYEALANWRLEHPNERGDSWLYTPLITEEITGGRVRSMRPEEYAAKREKKIARKKEALENRGRYPDMRLPEYALDDDMPALKEPSKVTRWCLRRCSSVLRASGKAWPGVKRAWRTRVEHAKDLLLKPLLLIASLCRLCPSRRNFSGSQRR